MNMTREKYPDPGGYVRSWRKVLSLPDNAVVLDAARFDLPVEVAALRANFLNALHNRINARGRITMQGRRWDGEYFVQLDQDRFDLHRKLRSRTKVFQFRTDLVSQRFGHLAEYPAAQRRRPRHRSAHRIRRLAFAYRCQPRWMEGVIRARRLKRSKYRQYA